MSRWDEKRRDELFGPIDGLVRHDGPPVFDDGHYILAIEIERLRKGRTGDAPIHHCDEPAGDVSCPWCHRYIGFDVFMRSAADRNVEESK